MKRIKKEKIISVSGQRSYKHCTISAQYKNKHKQYIVFNNKERTLKIFLDSEQSTKISTILLFQLINFKKGERILLYSIDNYLVCKFSFAVIYHMFKKIK